MPGMPGLLAVFPYSVPPVVERAAKSFLGTSRTAVLSPKEAYERVAKGGGVLVVTSPTPQRLKALREIGLNRIGNLPLGSVLVVTNSSPKPYTSLVEALGFDVDYNPFRYYKNTIRILHEVRVRKGLLYVAGHTSWWGMGYGNMRPGTHESKERKGKDGLQAVLKLYEEFWRYLQPVGNLSPIAPIPSSHVPLLALGGFFPRMEVETPEGVLEVATMPRKIYLKSPPTTDFFRMPSGTVPVTTEYSRPSYTLSIFVRYPDGQEVEL